MAKTGIDVSRNHQTGNGLKDCIAWSRTRASSGLGIGGGVVKSPTPYTMLIAAEMIAHQSAHHQNSARAARPRNTRYPRQNRENEAGNVAWCQGTPTGGCCVWCTEPAYRSDLSKRVGVTPGRFRVRT